AVPELERILGGDPRSDLLGRGRVEEPLEALAAADPHVMAALRAHIEIALELRPVEDRIARRTLDPQALGHRAGAALGLDARGHDLLEPGHEGRLGWES